MSSDLDPEYFELWKMPFSLKQRERFRDGSLRDAWFQQFEGPCFDSEDLRLATNQPGNHFFEWLASINLYASLGLHSLIEKYESKKTHPRKYEVLES